MTKNCFTNEEKIKAFDRIAKCFYNKNFGQKSKSDLDLLMFDIYLKNLINQNKDKRGIIEFNKCSDYLISRELGITQQRVRNLKIKDNLVYPDKDLDWEKEWKVALTSLIENARIDNKKITLNIPDPNLYLEIQNFIEKNGAYIEKQLNSKILQMRIEYFIELMIALEPEEEKQKIIKKLKKQFKDSNKDEKRFDEKQIGKSLIETTENITDIVANIGGLVSPTGLLGTVLKLITP